MDIPPDDGLKRFTMTQIKPGSSLPSYEEMHEQLVKQMTDMDEKEIHNIANIIVNLIKELRDASQK